MKVVSSKTNVFIDLPSSTMCKRGTYFCMEFNIIYKINIYKFKVNNQLDKSVYNYQASLVGNIVGQL